MDLMIGGMVTWTLPYKGFFFWGGGVLRGSSGHENGLYQVHALRGPLLPIFYCLFLG